MLTYEKVLSVFSDYLREDTDYEVVLTRHGYTVMGWDRYRKDWNNVVYCPTPTTLRNALLDSYASFAEMKISDGERDLTKKEQAQIKAECQKLRQKCKEGENKLGCF